MAEIRWTSEAATWLEDIHNYIAQENPSAAAKVAQGIHDRGNFGDTMLNCLSLKTVHVKMLNDS